MQLTKFTVWRTVERNMSSQRLDFKFKERVLKNGEENSVEKAVGNFDIVPRRIKSWKKKKNRRRSCC